MMPGMDQIPIGDKAEVPRERDADNVVHLPTSHEPAPEADPGTAVEAVEEGMSWEEAIAADADDEAAAEEPPPPPGSAIAGLLEQGVRVGAGLFSAGASAFADALRASMPEDAPGTEADPAAKIAGAGLGAAVTAAEAAAGAAGSAAETMAPLLSWLVNPPFLKGATEAAAGTGRVLDGQWQAAQAETVQAATSFLSALVPEIVGAVMDQIDLNKLVAERVDVDAIVARVDLDSVVDRIDVNAIVSKVDVNAIVEQVDFEAVIDRMDITAIAQDVLDDIDLPDIIRESSGSMASEGVQGLRVQGMNADRFVAKVLDRVLRRRGHRQVTMAEPTRVDEDG
jgi:hypothetical protein